MLDWIDRSKLDEWNQSIKFALIFCMYLEMRLFLLVLWTLSAVVVRTFICSVQPVICFVGAAILYLLSRDLWLLVIDIQNSYFLPNVETEFSKCKAPWHFQHAALSIWMISMFASSSDQVVQVCKSPLSPAPPTRENYIYLSSLSVLPLDHSRWSVNTKVAPKKVEILNSNGHYDVTWVEVWLESDLSEFNRY